MRTVDIKEQYKCRSVVAIRFECLGTFLDSQLMHLDLHLVARASTKIGARRSEIL